MNKQIDILCVGEILIDLIGHESNSTIAQTENFHRLIGGSPTNVAQNAKALGLKPLLVGTIGQDGFGDFIINELKKNGFDINYIEQLKNHSTSLICISKSSETPQFIPYRQSDFLINDAQLPDDIIASSKIIHTTCFALSKTPSRDAIMKAAKKAKAFNNKISIDLNFSNRIWPNKLEAFEVIKEYLSNGAILKISIDDAFRLFGESKNDEYLFDFFHNFGASIICLTKGKSGVSLSMKNGMRIEKKANILESVVDATGAGDAFWAGFLFGIINSFDIEKCVDLAQTTASNKLQKIGPLTELLIDLKKI